MTTEKELNKAKKIYNKLLIYGLSINVLILIISLFLSKFFITEFFIDNKCGCDNSFFYWTIVFVILSVFSIFYYFLTLEHYYLDYKDKKIDYWNNMSIKELRKLKIQKLNDN